MNRLLPFILLFLISLSGCSRQQLSEKEFTLVWGAYLQREFEESFDEKQSISQREKLLKDVCAEYTIDYDMLRQYMLKNHHEKYQKIFLNQ